MSIFRRDPDSTPAGSSAEPALPLSPGEKGAQLTYVARGSKVKGEISGQVKVVIDGEVEGTLQLEGPLLIGTEGRVQGDVSARHVKIGGKVVGNVRGQEMVEVLPGGGLEGDIAAPRVAIAEGAFFKGKVEMQDRQKRGSEPRQRSSTPAPEKSAE